MVHFGPKCRNQKFLEYEISILSCDKQDFSMLLLSSLLLYYNGMNQVNTLKRVHPNKNTRAQITKGLFMK